MEPLPVDLRALPPLHVTARADRVRAHLAERSGDEACEALVVTDLANVRWLTGFSGLAGRAVLLPDRLVLVTDGRYAERATAELGSAGCEGDVAVGQTRQELAGRLAASLGAVSRVGFEAEHVSWAEAERLRELLGRDVVPTGGVVERGRRAKDAAEIARIEAASAVTDRALADVLPLVEERPTERELQLALDRRMEDLGARGPSFATIVASGANAARPHHLPDQRRIEAGDTLIVDVGALVDGYHSDMTRTFVVGEPSAVQSEVYDVVAAAQAAGVAAVRDGVSGRDVDAVCREVISGAGWGEWFTHGTGHGVGLQIHESPWLTRGHDDVLAAGDVVTVEPGVYRSDLGGVRIEDTVVVTTDGCRLLTHAPKDPRCLRSPRTT